MHRHLRPSELANAGGAFLCISPVVEVTVLFSLLFLCQRLILSRLQNVSHNYAVPTTSVLYRGILFFSRCMCCSKIIENTFISTILCCFLFLSFFLKILVRFTFVIFFITIHFWGMDYISGVWTIPVTIGHRQCNAITSGYMFVFL